MDPTSPTSENGELEGRRALVTGGTRGIGMAIAETLRRRGAAVTVSGRGEESCSRASGGSADGLQVVRADVTDDAATRRLIASAVERWGGLDILVNNAGSFAGGELAALGDEAWVDALDGKLLGAIRTTRAALPHLYANESSAVVNISGLSSFRVSPPAALSAVNNAGMVTFTAYLAREGLGRGLRANCVVPGLILTESWRQRIRERAEASGVAEATARAEILAANGFEHARWGRPEEVAEAVAFLVSERAGFVTGADLRVDGGQGGLVL